ncbi:hypothetical protein [Clostridium intestinale]|uniref:Uncharacterized protein n=1 Tax=Clostridium intestinale TaxID=36845 RepID=A0A7D6VZE4_9CLOT|nr:hypothetical protein [Clostridium intestinale]QLY79205.1 hypothetical protein HZF06_19330 [Clostridium intestinale]
MTIKNQSTVLAVTNDYPKDKYNLLIPVKSMQELSSMYKIIVNEVQIDPDYNKANDVYVQTKGYKDSPDKLALTKTALSKLMTAAGINMVESRAIIPSTHQTAIEMAKAIGQAVPYDVRDIAHEVIIEVPEPSGQYRQIKATKEIIIEDLKAEYREQKKNMEIWEYGKKRPATEEEKEAAIEKQLTQFLSHKRAQCETKTLNRALREAMGIKATYTAEELGKPFIVAHTVPNLADPDLKQAVISRYAQSSSMLFPQRNEPKALEAPIQEQEEAEIIEAEIVAGCEKCGQVIEAIDDQWTVEAIVAYSKNKFRDKVYCPDCQKEILEAFRKSKEVKQ